MKPWTKPEQERLRQLRAAGLKHADIAAQLGRTVEAVQVRAAKLKLARRQARWTREEERRLARMHAAGQGVPAIAEALGRTPRAIGHRLAALGGRP